VESLGFGIAVIAFSAVSILLVSIYLGRRARQTDSPALEGDAAHLRTDAFTSFGVLAGLVLVEVTGEAWIDAAVALAVAAMIITTGIRLLTRASRVLMDEALPEDEMREIDRCARALADRGVVGYHKVRTRRAGPRRHIDLHVQFRSGTSLEDAHAIAHELERAIKGRLDNADVLIHIEPAASVRRGERFSWAGDVSDTGQK
jgi:cation diffusion facilitator family transporter